VVCTVCGYDTPVGFYEVQIEALQANLWTRSGGVQVY